MNIFFLHEEPKRAAQYHCDKHVIKMILECAQLLSTAHRVLDGTMIDAPKRGPWAKYRHPDPEMDFLLYAATHVNHPSAKWVRESAANYNWLYQLMLELNAEFVRRYKKPVDHLTIRRLKEILKNTPKNIPDADFTNPPPCMPEEFIAPDAVLSYRNYYNGAKADIARWTDTPVPGWFKKVG